jgi:hypothetical protein
MITDSLRHLVVFTPLLSEIKITAQVFLTISPLTSSTLLNTTLLYVANPRQRLRPKLFFIFTL